MGFFNILSCIVCARISAHYQREHEDEVFSHQIDNASLAVNGIGCYIAVNTALVVGAFCRRTRTPGRSRQQAPAHGSAATSGLMIQRSLLTACG